MIDVIKILQEKSDLLYGKGTSEELIRKAEDTLGLRFASDYRAYLLHFGIVAFDGSELTGIYPSTHLDVTKATVSERERNLKVPSNMYVIEKANIDGIIVWQSSEGDIYETVMNSEPIRVCQSLVEYISL